MIVLLILALCTLMVLSAFFSASETGLVSLSPQKAKSLALRTPHLREALQGWLIQPHEILTLILIGNTFVNVLFASLVTVGMVHYFPSNANSFVEFGSWLLGTIVIVLVGEMVPKFIARAYPERTSLAVLPWLSWLRRVTAPVMRIVIKPLIFFIPPLAASLTSGSVMAFSLEELNSLLEEDRMGTAHDDESMEMVHRVLEIHNRKVEAIMTPLSKVDLVEFDPPGKPPRSMDYLIDLIVEDGHTRTPVKKNGKLIGFIHCNDLLPSLLTFQTADLLSLVRPAFPVPAERRAAELLTDFRHNGIHMGFVNNDQGEIIGIVTLEDVLEELTGEILDEFDDQPTQGRPL